MCRNRRCAAVAVALSVVGATPPLAAQPQGSEAAASAATAPRPRFADFAQKKQACADSCVAGQLRQIAESPVPRQEAAETGAACAAGERNSTSRSHAAVASSPPNPAEPASRWSYSWRDAGVIGESGQVAHAISADGRQLTVESRCVSGPDAAGAPAVARYRWWGLLQRVPSERESQTIRSFCAQKCGTP